MVRAHVERERKYDVPESAEVPADFGESGLRLGPARELSLHAVYFDTPGLDLVRNGVSLRRRQGGDDEGWHVKVPHGKGAKLELHHPLGPAGQAVPRAVRNLLLAYVRDQPLDAVATISTTRTVHPLVAQGEPVALLCADLVLAHETGRERSGHAWQEWELELVEGQPTSILDDLEPILLEAGARRSAESSKLHRVLGADLESPWEASRERARAGDARAALQVRIAEQTRRVRENDVAFRGDAADSVHKLRIAARRLRSALTTGKQLFDHPPDELRAELRWFGQQLGPARDAQVLRERLRAAVDTEPDELVLGPVRRRLDLELNRHGRESVTKVVEVLGSERYFDLLRALDSAVAELGGAGDGPVEVGVADLVRRDAKKLRKAVRAIERAEPEGRDQALHDARKKAKRLRYAAELASVADARRAARLAKRAKAVQSALGEHQDSVVARRVLRDIGVAAFLDGENGFTFGLLAGSERVAAQQAQQRFREEWSRMPSPRRAAKWTAPAGGDAAES